MSLTAPTFVLLTAAVVSGKGRCPAQMRLPEAAREVLVEA